MASSRSGASPQPWPLSALVAKAQCHGSACPAAAQGSISGALCAWLWAPALHRPWETRTAPSHGSCDLFFFFNSYYFSPMILFSPTLRPREGRQGEAAAVFRCRWVALMRRCHPGDRSHILRRALGHAALLEDLCSQHNRCFHFSSLHCFPPFLLVISAVRVRQTSALQ